MADKTLKSRPEHLYFCRKNETGYKNLIYLDSVAYVDGFYSKPRCDYKNAHQSIPGLDLFVHHALRANCRLFAAGDYEAQKARRDDERGVRRRLLYKLQDHGIKEQKEVNPLLIKACAQN